MRVSSFLLISCCATAVCISAACASSAHIVIQDKSNYSLTAEFMPSDLLEKNIRHLLKQKNEQTDEQSMFNRRELKDSLSKAGLTVNDIALKGNMGLSIACTLPHTHELLKAMINYDRTKQKVFLRISPENIHAFLEMIPQDSRDFIDMLMAPLFTGEKIKPAEYEDLIGAAYGKKIAAELRKAEFILTVDVPYTIQTAQVSPVGTIILQKKTTNRASLHLPLLELLCTTGTIEVQLLNNS